MYQFLLFLNLPNAFLNFIYSLCKFKCMSERTGEKAVSVHCMTLFFFMLELPSLASFCSWASILLALQKFDLALEIAILRALSLCKSHRAYYFIQTEKILSLILHARIYTLVKLLSVRPQFFVCKLNIIYKRAVPLI